MIILHKNIVFPQKCCGHNAMSYFRLKSGLSKKENIFIFW